MNRNSVLTDKSGAAGEVAGARDISSAAPGLRVVPPPPVTAPVAEADGELVPPEVGSKALVKSFISNRSFETFLVLARMLVAAPEFPEALRLATLKAFEGIKSKEQREIISDAFKGYKPYAGRLPKGSAEEIATWCQDRSEHHHLYTVLGTTVALTTILATDQTLVQRAVASGLRENSVQVADELNRRFLAHYKNLFGDTNESYAQAFLSEKSEKNPMAVTLFLKGFLAPLLEIERPAKRGLASLFASINKVDAPHGFAGLSDVSWTEAKSSDLSALFEVAQQVVYKVDEEKRTRRIAEQREQERIKREAEEKELAAREAVERAARLEREKVAAENKREREKQEKEKLEVERKELAVKKAAEEAARLEREREEDKIGLQGITLVKLIDRRFVQRVLSAQGTTDEKIAFLTAAVALATTVDESAIIELSEQVPRMGKVSLMGDSTSTMSDRLVGLIKKLGIRSWDDGGKAQPYGPAMLAVALDKCSGLRNPAYAEIVRARFAGKSEEWCGDLKKEFVADVKTLFSKLISAALEKGVKLSNT